MIRRVDDSPNSERRRRAGEVIYSARLAKGWNQERLAELLTEAMGEQHVAGRTQTVGQSAVSRWESGVAAPEGWKLAAIEQVLGIDDGTLTAILYARPPRPVEDRGAAIEARLDHLEARIDHVHGQLAEMIELIRGLDRRIQDTSPDDGAGGRGPH